MLGTFLGSEQWTRKKNSRFFPTNHIMGGFLRVFVDDFQQRITKAACQRSRPRRCCSWPISSIDRKSVLISGKSDIGYMGGVTECLPKNFGMNQTSSKCRMGSLKGNFFLVMDKKKSPLNWGEGRVWDIWFWRLDLLCEKSSVLYVWFIIWFICMIYISYIHRYSSLHFYLYISPLFFQEKPTLQDMKH